MYEIRRTDVFTKWLDRLRDARARVRVLSRLTRVEEGNLGDTKPVGEGVSEFRIDYGPGYRVYYTQRNKTIIILLVGGDKSTQTQDIKRAIQLARDLDE
ncbi:MAG: type II toxin-antitoxin system RelE/ParE family toxin [Gammaproteobacteria bacterium]